MESPMRRAKKSGLTLLEILVLLSAIVPAAIIVMPMFKSHERCGRRTVCGQNMGQIHKAITMYESDYSVYPPGAGEGKNVYTDGDAQAALSLLYREYADDIRIFSCPSKKLPA